jgi:hypothetical protein
VTTTSAATAATPTLGTIFFVVISTIVVFFISVRFGGCFERFLNLSAGLFLNQLKRTKEKLMKEYQD